MVDLLTGQSEEFELPESLDWLEARFAGFFSFFLLVLIDISCYCSAFPYLDPLGLICGPWLRT